MTKFPKISPKYTQFAAQTNKYENNHTYFLFEINKTFSNNQNSPSHYLESISPILTVLFLSYHAYARTPIPTQFCPKHKHRDSSIARDSTHTHQLCAVVKLLLF